MKMISCVCLLSAVTVLAATEAEPPKLAPVPGQLDVVEMTAVSLDARLPEGTEPVTFRWRIIEGEGGKLFSEDKEDAVFLAPKFDRAKKEFLVELTVTYVDQPPSTRQMRIRVLPTNPDEAEEFTDDGTPQWLIDKYDRAREYEEQNKSSSGSAIVAPRSGPTTSIGVWGGSGGRSGASIGLRWNMSYPITQPVEVPPPGESHEPGEGTWAAPTPVPHDQLSTTFPAEVVERYQPAEDAEPEESEPQPETESKQD